jgi:hypothetical protein
VFQRPTPKKSVVEKKRHFTCTGRMQILPNYFVRGHRWNAEGAASGLFRGVPGRVQKGSPPIFLEIFKLAFGAGNLTTCVGNGISHCALYCALYCSLYCILHRRNNFCTVGNNFCTAGNNFCTAGNNFCTTGNNFCTAENNFCTAGTNFCIVENNFCTAGNNFCTAGNNFCLRGSWGGLVGGARRQGWSAGARRHRARRQDSLAQGLVGTGLVGRAHPEMVVLRRPNARPQRQCAFRLHESAVSGIGSPD